VKVATVFITGTGTDVGKTFIAAALIRHLRGAGAAVEAIKPVVSGFDPDHAAVSDPGVLLDALGRELNAGELDRISPWRFAAPLSPDLAARAEGLSMDFRALVDFCHDMEARTRGHLLIEGVGGVMVPLDVAHTVLDWMTALRAPVLLVAGSYLGTISHTLTALHVLAQRRLDIAGVVVSESSAPGAPLDDTVATIARFAAPIEVIGVPRVPAGTLLPEGLLGALARLIG
jgi:dethiobiotin synthetase